MHASQLKAQIEQTLPAAFTFYAREYKGSIPTGIAQIDDVVRGVPLCALTEICSGNPGSTDGAGFAGWGGKPGSPHSPLLAGWGAKLISSGKTSVLLSLLAQATRDHFCALVDAADGFDPASGQAAGIDFSRLLWVRCGKNKIKLPPLEQAFKVADILLQSGGFGLIAVDLSGISECIVRKIPLTTWFRFSRVIERQPAALVFLELEPHATSCAGLVLRVATDPPVLKGKLFTERNLNCEIVRCLGKRPVSSERFFPESKYSLPKRATESMTRREEIENEASLHDFSPCLGASMVPLTSQGA